MNNKLEVIGIDHGWSMMKTISQVFVTGVTCMRSINEQCVRQLNGEVDESEIGDEIMITDKNGLKHIYEVTETEIVNPYDNSIKTQGDEKELTLFTCSQKGTMRFVVRCIYKEAVMDE